MNIIYFLTISTDRDYERGRGDYPPPAPRDRGYDRERVPGSRDYKSSDKRDNYDDRRDTRMESSPYPPDRRSMKRSREYDQREPKESYGRDERDLYDRRDRDRRTHYYYYYYYFYLSHVYKY